ncbi:MAG: homoserine kinase [Bacteroidota bacterium]|nr:homoserine kinase [Bacteroidota bacterium]MDQ6889566.1 homoserine kinase [Bacteroidota bacterium]
MAKLSTSNKKRAGKWIRVLAPATIANLVCGFDVLGLALKGPCDIMKVAISETPGIRIQHNDAFDLPTIPEQNVAGVALLDLLQEVSEPVGFDIIIEKHIKPGSGLGSSAASAAGIVVAANHLLGNLFSKEELVRFAMAGEKLASGVKHADNISPGIFGGVTLIRSIFPLDIITLPAPPLFVAVVHPQIEVKTSDAREILRKEVLLKDAIKQWGNIAGLVAGFMKNDYGLISRSLEDVIIEPVRSMLIPGFDEVKKKSVDAGALGGGISGSGPSIFMLCEKERTAKKVEKIMKDIYDNTGLAYYTYVTTINNEGIKIESSKEAI